MSVGRLVLLGSGLLYLLLGLWVLSLRPRPARNVYLGVYAVGFGLMFITSNAMMVFDSTFGAAIAVQAPFAACYGIAAFLLARVGFGADRQDHALVAASAILGLLVGLTWAILLTDLYVVALPPLLVLSYGAGEAIGFGGVAGGIALLGLRAHPAQGRRWPNELDQPALLTVAFATFPAALGGTAIALAPHDPPRTWMYLLVVAGWIPLGAVWIRNLLAAGSTRIAAVHKQVVLAIFGLIAAGALWQTAFPTPFGLSPFNGFVRTFGILLLVYAIVRHQLLGIDVKVRWTISRSAIAAIFISIFFVASEAAQQFFGDKFESGYLGILAAGALVFALAPLSRLADRLAEKAVPVSETQPIDRIAFRADSAYRAALRAAMRDGVMTRREEVHMAEVAENLGIGHRRALEVRAEVEREQGL